MVMSDPKMRNAVVFVRVKVTDELLEFDMPWGTMGTGLPVGLDFAAVVSGNGNIRTATYIQYSN